MKPAGPFAAATRAITSGLALWALLGAVAAYLWPERFEWTGWKGIAGEPLFKWFFALTMFTVGTVIDTSSFAALAKRPLAVLLGLATQFTVMPALAWGTARLAGFDDSITLGFIIVGCAPGAMTSNVLTYLARGDTAYSVTLTTFASLISVLVTPLLVLSLAGEELGMTWAKFVDQVWTICWTVAAPLVLGLSLRRFTPRLRSTYERASPAIASISIVLICCFVIQWTHAALDQATLGVFAAVVVINALGFLLGGMLATLYRLERAKRVTLAIEVGMQNAGMGVVLATDTFSDRPSVAIPAALFTIWCILTAAGLIAALGRSR